jgi:D-alanyl-D-alanine carboxypeptidase
VNDSGFNLVASAQRDGVRLIAAVFGGQSGRERDRHMMALLDQGFLQMGVAPTLRRSLPPMMASAQAAPLRGARAMRRAVAAAPTTRVAARPTTRAQTTHAQTTHAQTQAASTGRPALLRTVTTRNLRAVAPRIEQGDAAGRSTGRMVQPARPPVARPTKAQAPRRR